MTTTFEIRQLQSDDVEACTAVYGACEAVDGPQIFMSAEDMAATMKWPRFGLDTSWVAEIGGRVVGYLENTARRPDAERGRGRSIVHLHVHPDHRRRGIGGALWDKAVLGARHHRLGVLDVTAFATSQAGLVFARARGLRQAAIAWKMGLAPGAHRPGPVGHAATLRAFRGDEADFAGSLRAYNLSFAEHFGYIETTAADLRVIVAGPAFENDLLLLAELGGEIVGFSHNDLSEAGEGWVESLGVVPAARGTGLGRRLLDRSVKRLLGRGASRVALNVVGDNERALRLYRSAGFEIELEQRVFRMELDAARAAPAPAAARAPETSLSEESS